MDAKRFEELAKSLSEGLYERDYEARIILLTALAGENIFLLGEPGIAKSLIAQRLQYIFKDAKYFQYLMHKFTEPDQIFGPLSIAELKKDKYHIQTAGYLPEADVVFLDEIWKASSSIQNTLLTVLNEHRFNNGTEFQQIKLKAFISASNELPAKGEGLEALWDRFVVRLMLKPIQVTESFMNYLDAKDSQAEIKVTHPITEDELNTIRTAIEKINLGKTAREIIEAFRLKIADHNNAETNKDNQIFVSDRRWKKIAQFIKTAAFINGHSEPDIIDTSVMLHSLWNKDTQIETIQAMWQDIAVQYGQTADYGSIVDELSERIAALTRSIESTYKGDLVMDDPNKDGYIQLSKPLDITYGYNNSLKIVAIHKDTIDSIWQNQNIQTVEDEYIDIDSTFLIQTGIYSNKPRFESYQYQCTFHIDKAWENGKFEITSIDGESVLEDWEGQIKFKSGGAKSFPSADIQNLKDIDEIRKYRDLFLGWEKIAGNIQTTFEAELKKLVLEKDKSLSHFNQNCYYNVAQANPLVQAYNDIETELKALELKLKQQRVIYAETAQAVFAKLN